MAITSTILDVLEFFMDVCLDVNGNPAPTHELTANIWLILNVYMRVSRVSVKNGPKRQNLLVWMLLAMSYVQNYRSEFKHMSSVWTRFLSTSKSLGGQENLCCLHRKCAPSVTLHMWKYVCIYLYVWVRLWLTSDMWLMCFCVIRWNRVSSPLFSAIRRLQWLPPTSHQPIWSRSWSMANSNRLQSLRWWSRRTLTTSAWPFQFAMEWFCRLSGLSIILLSATTYSTWENLFIRRWCGGRRWWSLICCRPKIKSILFLFNAMQLQNRAASKQSSFKTKRLQNKAASTLLFFNFLLNHVLLFWKVREWSDLIVLCNFRTHTWSKH